MKTILQVILLFTSFIIYAQDGTFTEYKYKCTDGVERPYTIYRPKNIQSENAPLVVYLHGAISNPSLKENPLDYMKKSKWVALADEGGFNLMFSFGQKGATWFDEVGEEMILGEIQKVTEEISVNENKIFLTGFSDGGSGVFYLSMNVPETFAGFIPMNGSIRVAEVLGQRSMFPRNMNEKPFLVFNTDSDMLYPLHQITPTIEHLKKFNPNVVYKVAKGNHEMSYIEDFKNDIFSFIQGNKKLNSKKIFWELDSTTRKYYQWLSVISIDENKGVLEDVDYQLELYNDKSDFGVNYDYSYKGKGLKIKSFKENSALEKMGAKVGDILMKMENIEMTSPYSPYEYLSAKRAEQPTSVTIERDGNSMILDGVFNKGKVYYIFTKKPLARMEVNMKGNKIRTSKKNIKEFKINQKGIK